MLKITACFSTILILILSFGMIDVFAQTVKLNPVYSLTGSSISGVLGSITEIHIVTIDSTPYAIVSNTTDDYDGIIIIDISNPKNPIAGICNNGQ